MKSLVDEFYTVLHLASAEQPIVLILDSLDQFSAEHNARQLFWLPGKLPNHVKMLLSTLPGQEYECFPRLKVGHCFRCNIQCDHGKGRTGATHTLLPQHHLVSNLRAERKYSVDTCFTCKSIFLLLNKTQNSKPDFSIQKPL